MGKSSEEFMKQRERLQDNIPLIDSKFVWGNYFKELGEYYNKQQNEARNI
jgi:hypothetical protein